MNYKGIKPSVLAVMLAAALVMNQGCSIKEDRSRCPCMLVMDFTDVELSGAGIMEMQVAGSDGFLYYDDDIFPDLFSEAGDEGERLLYVVSVPGPEVSVTVIGNSGGTFRPGEGLLIPYGSECPEVSMYHSSLSVSPIGEEAGGKVVMHKDYCRIGIRMLSVSEDYPFSLSVEGNVGGIGTDRSPLQGRFSYSFVSLDDGIGCVNVPRQYDDSLVLLVKDGNRVLREFALGEYIAESGYDWAAEDLEDIEVSIDYAHSLIIVDVAGWSEAFEYDVVI